MGVQGGYFHCSRRQPNLLHRFFLRLDKQAFTGICGNRAEELCESPTWASHVDVGGGDPQDETVYVLPVNNPLQSVGASGLKKWLSWLKIRQMAVEASAGDDNRSGTLGTGVSVFNEPSEAFVPSEEVHAGSETQDAVKLENHEER
jgi:hypothetical protein